MYLARSSPTVLTWFMDASSSGLQRPHSGTPRPPGASTPSQPLTFDALSGASVGAVNAVIIAAGLLAGGKAEARRRLDHFWERSSQMAPPNPGATATFLVDMASRLISPYQINPFNLNPLEGL